MTGILTSAVVVLALVATVAVLAATFLPVIARAFSLGG